MIDRPCRIAILTAALMLGALTGASAQLGAPKFASVSAFAPKTIVPGKPFVVSVYVKVERPYHIQANPPKPGYIATEVKFGAVPGLTFGKTVYPLARRITVGGDVLPVYEGTVTIMTTVVPAPTAHLGRTVIPISVRMQGCNDKTCYPPATLKTTLVTTVGGKAPPGKRADAREGTLILAQSTTPTNSGTGNSAAVSVPGFEGAKITQFLPPKEFVSWLHSGQNEEGLAGRVKDLLGHGSAESMAGALGLIYLLGLALNLTPCVYPLIPITIGYFGRQAASGAKTGVLSLCYALGMALMYSILGIVAALLGKGFGTQLNSPAVLVGFAVLMFALGVSMFDRPDGRPIWEMQLPSSLTSKAKSRAGYAGALLMGLMVGIVAAPCIGPIVVALIQVISTTRNVALGLVTFFTLGVGLSTPYLLLGFGLVKSLPRAGEWMVSVKRIFGLLLFGMGIYYLQGVLPAAVYKVLFPGFVVCAGAYLVLLDKTGRAAKRFFLFKRAIGAAAVVGGFLLFLPHSAASARAISFEQPKDYAALQSRLDAARAQGRDVLIDFSASWCAACKELDEQTFRDPNVVRATGNTVAMRFQLEDFDSDYAKPFVATFGIVGLPTVVHLVPKAASEKTAAL